MYMYTGEHNLLEWSRHHHTVWIRWPPSCGRFTLHRTGSHTWLRTGSHTWLRTGSHTWLRTGSHTWLRTGSHTWLRTGSHTWLVWELFKVLPFKFHLVFIFINMPVCKFLWNLKLLHSTNFVQMQLLEIHVVFYQFVYFRFLYYIE